MLSDTDELRYLAMVVIEHQVPGPFLAAHLQQMERGAGEESSAATRLAAREIAPRRPGLSPAEVATELVHRADTLDSRPDPVSPD